MKIRKRIIKIAFIVIIILIIGYWAFKHINKGIYKFRDDAFSYSKHRGKAIYEMSLKSKNKTFDIYNINFKSRNFLDYQTRIYGFVLMPKGEKEFPGLVLLPGGGVTKESELNLASKIAGLGYAVLTIDQRGIGETGGHYLDIEQDYKIFSNGKEPIQHLSVYDALMAFDVLRSIGGIDKNNIAIAGESMGGRYAIIAAALDKRLKGVVGISTSGFNIKNNDHNNINSYLLSIDPDHYIAKISPNYVFMIHGNEDRTIRLQDAQHTFNLAKKPKRFFITEGCGHGYCKAMFPYLNISLKELFGK